MPSFFLPAIARKLSNYLTTNPSSPLPRDPYAPPSEEPPLSGDWHAPDNVTRPSMNPSLVNYYDPSSAMTQPIQSSGPDINRDVYLPRLQQLQGQIASAYQPPTTKGFKGALNVGRELLGGLLSRKNPQLGAEISGAAETQRKVAPLENEYQNISNVIAQNRAQQSLDLQRQNVQSEMGERTARANELQRQTELMGQPKPKEEDWSVVPGMQGPNGELVQQERNSGQVRFIPLQGVTGKGKAPEVKYQGGLPVSVSDQTGKEWAANDPNMPKELKALVDAGTAQHHAAVQEDINKAVAIQNAVNKGSGAALANVPPHLAAPATAAATKASDDYAQSQAVTQRLREMMDAAKRGNVVSYQLIPEEGALQIVTSQGVKRINMAEIQNYGGGSLWQRMQGHIGKQLSGKSIPDSVLNDMSEMQAIMQRGSRSKYENTLKGINKNYGSNFQPEEMPIENAPGGGGSERPVYRGNKLIGYTLDGKTLSRVAAP